MVASYVHKTKSIYTDQTMFADFGKIYIQYPNALKYGKVIDKINIYFILHNTPHNYAIYGMYIYNLAH